MIRCKIVAEKYMEILKSIHVDFSPAKTHKSFKFYEFAKRIVYNGVEISPFPISALSRRGNGDIILLLLREMSKRGYLFSDMESSVSLYFSVVMEFRSSLCSRIGLNSIYFSHVLDLIQGIVPAYEVFNHFLRKNNLPEHFKEEDNLTLEKGKDLTYLRMLRNNIIEIMGDIKGMKMSSVMKSSTLLTSYHKFCDEHNEKCDNNENQLFKHLIISSPFYGALYALEKEVKNERDAIEQMVDNTSVSINKRNSKSRLMNSKVHDLLVVKNDRKKIVNTAREFYSHIEKLAIIEYKKRTIPHYIGLDELIQLNRIVIDGSFGKQLPTFDAKIHMST